MICELIRREHDEVVDLFDRLVVLSRDGRHLEECARVAARLVAVVRIHARAEERVVYEVLRTHDPVKGFALAGPHVHENIDSTLDKLLVRAPGDDDFPIIVKVARDLFDMHARDEEEAEILPLMEQLLTRDELRTLATDMQAESARIRPQVLRMVGFPRAA